MLMRFFQASTNTLIHMVAFKYFSVVSGVCLCHTLKNCIFVNNIDFRNMLRDINLDGADQIRSVGES